MCTLLKCKNRSNFFNTAVILSGEYVWMIFHFLLHISHSRIIFEVIRTCLPYSAAWAAMNHIYLLQRCQPVEISNLENFFGPAHPPPMWLPSRKFFFNLDPIPPPPPAILQEKRGSICQGLQLVEYLSNQTLAYIGVTKKKLCSFCLQQQPHNRASH